MSHLTPKEIRDLSDFIKIALALIELSNKEDLQIQMLINGIRLLYPLFLKDDVTEQIECLDLTSDLKDQLIPLFNSKRWG
jgi:hypothetical protein